jgi:methyl-accepting chemotaxis protein/PAS domain-containing protein
MTQHKSLEKKWTITGGVAFVAGMLLYATARFWLWSAIPPATDVLIVVIWGLLIASVLLWSLYSHAKNTLQVMANTSADTEAKSSEVCRQLRQENFFLRALIDNLPDYMFVKDRQSNFLVNNEPHLHLLGLQSQAEAYLKSDFDFFPEALVQQYYDQEQTIMATGRALIDFVEPVENQETGQPGWNSTTKIPIKDETGEGEYIGLIGLARDVSAQKNAEAGVQTLLAHITEAAEKISNTTVSLSANATQAEGALAQVAQTMQDVLASARQQQTSLEQMDAMIDQTMTAINQVGQNAAAGAEGAAKAANVARNGVPLVEETVARMSKIQTKVDSSVQKVQEMRSHSDQVEAIVETIDEIAGQINLLALNAAIEAARAGEYGKGFAVVADEVRKLAEKSTVATQEIGGLIHGIQKTSAEAVLAMNETAQEVEKGAGGAADAGNILGHIYTAVETVDKHMTQILSANERTVEQGQMVSKEIMQFTQTGQEHADFVMYGTAATEQLTTKIQEFTESVTELTEMVDTFYELLRQFSSEKITS